MKIGVITDCMKMQDLDSALLECKRLGVSGVQIYATLGEFSPRGLTAEKKEHYKALLAELGLEVSALCGDGRAACVVVSERHPRLPHG